MPISRPNPQYKQWLQLLESVCQKLYNDRKAKHSSREKLCDSGIRILLAAAFVKLARDEKLDDSKFRSCFVETDDNDLSESSDKLEKYLQTSPALLQLNDSRFPGVLYEELLKYSLSIGNKGVVSLSRTRSSRKTGTFYTPKNIVRFIVKEALKPLIDNRSAGEIKKIRVCDPAMGTGNFLFEAEKVLTESIVAASGRIPQSSIREIRKSVISHCLYGMDIDPVAVSVTRACFALQSGVNPREFATLTHADGLLDKVPQDWKFDAVIGNPPWLTYGLRDVKHITKDLNGKYRSMFPNTAEYKISTYALFVEKALSLTKTDGYHSFIVPDSWLTGRYFSKLRNFLVTTTSLMKIVLIKKDFWRGIHIGGSVVYVVRKSRNPIQNGTIKVCRIGNPDDLEKTEMQSINISMNRITRRPHTRIVVYPDDRIRAIVEKMEDSGDILGSHLRFYSGLIGKNGKRSILIGKEYQPGPNTPIAETGKVIESGRNLECNRLAYTGYSIRREKKLYKSGYDEIRYLEPKIFVNQTGYRLKAFYDDRGYFCLNNMHIAYPVQPESTDLRFYAALLNSRILDVYYRVMSMEDGRALAQTDIDFLHQLPTGRDSSIAAQIKNIIATHQKFEINNLPGSRTEYTHSLPDNYQGEIERLFCEWYGISHSDLTDVSERMNECKS